MWCIASVAICLFSEILFVIYKLTNIWVAAISAPFLAIALPINVIMFHGWIMYDAKIPRQWIWMAFQAYSFLFRIIACVAVGAAIWFWLEPVKVQICLEHLIAAAIAGRDFIVLCFVLLTIYYTCLGAVKANTRPGDDLDE